MKWIVFAWLTATLGFSLPLAALEQVSVAVAESEMFEAVGRLEDEGLAWFVDRAESNAPVLGATLEVEFAGKAVQAVFRPAQGDYLIADADWLRPLRQPGEHALGLTLLIGEESDLLTAELHVEPTENPASTAGATPWATLAVALLLATGWGFWRRLRQGGVA